MKPEAPKVFGPSSPLTSKGSDGYFSDTTTTPIQSPDEDAISPMKGPSEVKVESPTGKKGKKGKKKKGDKSPPKSPGKKGGKKGGKKKKKRTKMPEMTPEMVAKLNAI